MVILPTELVKKVSCQFDNSCIDFNSENISENNSSTNNLPCPAAFVTETKELYVGNYDGTQKGLLWQVARKDKVEDGALFMHHIFYITSNKNIYIQPIFKCSCSLENILTHSSESESNLETMSKTSASCICPNANMESNSTDLDMSSSSCQHADETIQDVHTNHASFNLKSNCYPIKLIYDHSDNLPFSLPLNIQSLSSTSTHLLFVLDCNQIWYCSRESLRQALVNMAAASSTNNVKDGIDTNDSLVGHGKHEKADCTVLLPVKKLSSFPNMNIIQLSVGPNCVSVLLESQCSTENNDCIISTNATDQASSKFTQENADIFDESQCLCDQCSNFIEESNFSEENLVNFFDELRSDSNTGTSAALPVPCSFGTSFIRSRGIYNSKSKLSHLGLSLLGNPEKVNFDYNSNNNNNDSNKIIPEACIDDKDPNVLDSDNNSDSDNQCIGSTEKLAKSLQEVIDGTPLDETTVLPNKKEPYSYFDVINSSAVISLVTSGIGDYVGQITKHLRQVPTRLSTDEESSARSSPTENKTSAIDRRDTDNNVQISSSADSEYYTTSSHSDITLNSSKLSRESTETFSNVEEPSCFNINSTNISIDQEDNVTAPESDSPTCKNILSTNVSSSNESLSSHSSGKDSHICKSSSSRKVSIVTDKDVSILTDAATQNGLITQNETKSNNNMTDDNHLMERKTSVYSLTQDVLSPIINMQFNGTIDGKTPILNSSFADETEDQSSLSSTEVLVQMSNVLLNREVYVCDTLLQNSQFYKVHKLCNKSVEKLVCSLNYVAGITASGEIFYHTVTSSETYDINNEESKDLSEKLVNACAVKDIVVRDVATSATEDIFLFLSQTGQLYVKKISNEEHSTDTSTELTGPISLPVASSIFCSGDTLLLSEAAELSSTLSNLLNSESEYAKLMSAADKYLFSPLLDIMSARDQCDGKDTSEQQDLSSTDVKQEIDKKKVVYHNCLLCKAQISANKIDSTSKKSPNPVLPSKPSSSSLLSQSSMQEAAVQSIPSDHVPVLSLLFRNFAKLALVANSCILNVIECTKNFNISHAGKSLSIVRRCNAYCNLYASFIDSLNDAIALNALRMKSTESIPILEKALPHLIEYLPGTLRSKICNAFNKEKSLQDSLKKSKSSESIKKESILDRLKKDDSVTGEEFKSELLGDLFAVLNYFLHRPLERISFYENTLSAIEGADLAHHKWRQLSLLAVKAENEAIKTRDFWKSWINLPQSVYLPKQRIILDSRDYGSVKLLSTNGGKLLGSLNLSSSGYIVLLSSTLLHCMQSSHTVYWLHHIWVSPDDSPISQTSLELVLPEEKLCLTFSSHQDRKTWYKAITDGIRSSCSEKQVGGVFGEWSIICAYNESLETGMAKYGSCEERTAQYVFTKHPLYKGAHYSGQWRGGQLEGKGKLIWRDGSSYKGYFRANKYHGTGTLTVPASAATVTKDILNGAIFVKGHWKEGRLDGWCHIRYSTGQAYTGWVTNNYSEIYGSLQSGNLSTGSGTCSGAAVVNACVYTGGWKKGLKDGYGVEDNIGSGSKYMGQFCQGEKHGSAAVITSNGAYYEVNFVHGKPLGSAFVVLEDGTVFDGEVIPVKNSPLELACYGKGTFYYRSGERLEGTFSGPLLSSGKLAPVKVSNGLLHRAGSDTPLFSVYTLGTYSCSMEPKWSALFGHYEQLLANVKSKITVGCSEDITAKKDQTSDVLSVSSLLLIYSYLDKAFNSRSHPLSHLLIHIVAVFRASYGSSNTTAPAFLVPYALQEINFYTSKLYIIVRSLFPVLPPLGTNIVVTSEDSKLIVLTPSCLIHTWLLPQLYSPLSTLYLLCEDNSLPQLSYPQSPAALSPHLVSPSSSSLIRNSPSYCASPTPSPTLHPLHSPPSTSALVSDKQYWSNLCSWNMLPDYKILLQLDVARSHSPAPADVLSLKKGELFAEAIEVFQMITTSFLPRAKLSVVQLTFRIIQKMLHTSEWCSLDALFPVFVYVVIRARVQRLGVEIRLMDDLLEEEFKQGELNYMYINLVAAYTHICSMGPPLP